MWDNKAVTNQFYTIGLMRTERFGNHLRVIIDPGEFYASSVPVTISTLLGSCVAACLYDPVNKVIGMNHFMLSHRRCAKGLPMTRTEAGRYGVHSMELLLNEMFHQGAEKRYLKAKAFGGSLIIGSDSDTGNFRSVGEVNSNFIREFLTCEQIPLIAENFGGKEGRVIHFSYRDFAVYMRRIKSVDKSRSLVIRDRNCWMNAVAEQERQRTNMDNVELWK